MATLDWSQCPVVESIPGKASGAWVIRETRTPVQVLFENLGPGMSIEEVIEQFPVTREQLERASGHLWHVYSIKPRPTVRSLPDAGSFR